MNISELASIQFEPGAVGPEGTISLCVPEIRGNEWEYIQECLNSNWVSSVGPFVDRFERSMAAYVGAQYAVATVNGTAALHLALLVSGVQPDDEVLIPALTFIAPANAIRYVGAWPVFIDVDPHHWQIDPQKVVDFLRDECRWIDGELRNSSTGRRVKAILPVHILGHPCDMDPIVEIASKFELRVIEDATESLAAKYKGRMVGDLGDISCFSFNGNKVITTGGGGMILTNNQEWAAKARFLSTQAKDDPIEYVHTEIGYNYRLTNIQAAMGCAQMEQLDGFIAAKRRIAATYTNALAEIPGISFMQEAAWAWSTSWLYTVLIDSDQYGMGSRDLLRALESQNIQARPLWQPLHRSVAHSSSQAYRIEHTDLLHQSALSLPCSVGLTDSDLERVVGVIRDGRTAR